MTLIEESELERLRQRQIKDYNPALKSLVFVQDQIEKLFNDSELDYERKHKILCYLQNKFGVLYKNFKNNPANVPAVVLVPPTVVADEQNELPVEEPPPPPGPLGDMEVAEENDDDDDQELKVEKFDDALNSGEFALQVNLPSQYQKKFDLFQTFLAQHKKEIRSNAAGELVLDGVIIPNSSFSELLR